MSNLTGIFVDKIFTILQCHLLLTDISAILKPANPSHYDFVKVMKSNLIDFDVINQTERISGTLKSRTYGGDGRLVHSEITILLNDRVFLFKTGQIL